MLNESFRLRTIAIVKSYQFDVAFVSSASYRKSIPISRVIGTIPISRVITTIPISIAMSNRETYTVYALRGDKSCVLKVDLVS